MDNPQICPPIEQLYTPVFRLSILEFLAMILPWVGVVLDQLFHRGFISSIYGQIFVFASFLCVFVLIATLIKTYNNTHSPVRQIFPIIFVMAIGSLVSFIVAVIAYLTL